MLFIKKQEYFCDDACGMQGGAKKTSRKRKPTHFVLLLLKIRGTQYTVSHFSLICFTNKTFSLVHKLEYATNFEVPLTTLF
jgi:hypothetical protein